MGLEDFINDFLDFPISEIDQEYMEIEAKYKALFGHIVPRDMIPSGISMETIKNAMLESIELRKDIVLKKLGVNINSEYLY